MDTGNMIIPKVQHVLVLGGTGTSIFKSPVHIIIPLHSHVVASVPGVEARY